jgi:hypothetical protein
MPLSWFAVILLTLYILSLLWPRWSSQRRLSKRSEDFRRYAAMTRGYVFHGSPQARPWTNGLRPPFGRLVFRNFLERVNVHSDIRYEHALEFIRHGRRVRISEASIFVRRLNTSYFWDKIEHRVEIQALRAPTMWVTPLKRSDWYDALPPVPLPEPYASQMSIHSDAPDFVARALPAFEVLARRKKHLPYSFQVERGVLHYATSGPATEETVTLTVDALVAFLDRLCGPAAGQHQFAAALATLPQREYPDPSRFARGMEFSSYVLWLVSLVFSVVSTITG